MILPRRICFFIGATFFAVFFVNCSRPDSSVKKAPSFQADIFSPKGQSRFSLKEENKQKPVLLVFWASWCESCKEEIPKLNQMMQDYREKIEIVSVNAQEEATVVAEFLAQTKIDFPVMLDESGKISSLFEVTALPAVLLLAKGGEILYYGFRLPDRERLEDLAFRV